MANTQAVATSFKVEQLNGIHAFGVSVVRAATTADTFKAALYLATATVNATTSYRRSIYMGCASGNRHNGLYYAIGSVFMGRFNSRAV
jgi:hypothetical protein